jgi:hypothetical protein
MSIQGFETGVSEAGITTVVAKATSAEMTAVTKVRKNCTRVSPEASFFQNASAKYFRSPSRRSLVDFLSSAFEFDMASGLPPSTITAGTSRR